VRHLRMLLSAVAVATATGMAVVAPAALGLAEQHKTFEVTNEKNGVHCPAVNPNHAMASGCLVHLTSDGELEVRKHVFGIESHIAKCEVEMWHRVNENSEGFFFHQKFIDHPAGDCNRQPCDGGAAPPNEWPMHGDEKSEAPPPLEGDGKVETVLCIEPDGGGTDETCEIELPLAETATKHRYKIGAMVEMSGHGVSGFRCEVVGRFTTEAAEGYLENDNTKQKENIIEVEHYDKVETETP
jgi:hypothetical protein